MTIVPPLKSTPYRNPCLTTSETSPNSMTEPEIARYSLRLPSQLTLTSLKISIIGRYLLDTGRCPLFQSFLTVAAVIS